MACSSVVAAPIYYSKNEYFQTASGTKVSKKSVLCGSQNIHITGKSIIRDGVILRGDLAHLRLGKYVVIGENSVIHPPTRKAKGATNYFPLSIGDFVTIGANTVVSAAQIGTNVSIGENCIIGKRCIIKDNAVILPGTILPPDTNVPPYAAFGGCPGCFVGELPESAHLVHREKAKAAYAGLVQRGSANTSPGNAVSPRC